MRKILKFSAPILVLGGGILVTIILNSAKPTAEKTIEPPRPTSLYVADAQKEMVSLSVRTQGEVRPKTEINLIPEVSGRVLSVSDRFVEGGQFKKGDILVQIDPADYKLAVTRAKAQVAEARVRLEQELADARIKAKQWEDWVHEGEPTPLALNKPQVAEAEAKLLAAEADLADAELDLARTQLVAPFDGRVTSRNTGPGQVVNVGSDLGSIFADDVVEIRLPLSDKQLADLALPIGYVAASGTSGPAVTFSALLGGTVHEWQGEIRRVNAAIDSKTRLAYAIAEVHEPYGAAADHTGMPIAVGLFVEAHVESMGTREAISIPRPALRGEGKVFVVNTNQKLEIRTIEILSTDAEKAWVTTGLSGGDRVVVSPVIAPRSGMDVIPLYKEQAGGMTNDSARAKSR